MKLIVNDSRNLSVNAECVKCLFISRTIKPFTIGDNEAFVYAEMRDGNYVELGAYEKWVNAENAFRALMSDINKNDICYVHGEQQIMNMGSEGGDT